MFVRRRRTAAICLVLVALITVGAACSSSNSKTAKAKQAQAASKAKTKGARAAAAQRRLAASRAIARQRHAYVAEQGRVQAQPAPATPVPATLPAILPTAPPTIPPTTVPVVAPATPAADLAAIQRTFTGLNLAFRTGVAAGIAGSNAVNYWVAAGVYSAMQCSNFETSRGQGVVAEAFVVHPESLKPAIGWVDPTVGKPPTGRVYSISVDNTETLVPTGQKRQQTVVMHASVNPAGTAYLFLRCA